LDRARLEANVIQYPSWTLKQRAKEFGVRPSAIWYALSQLKITRKKRAEIPRERPRREAVVFEECVTGNQS